MIDPSEIEDAIRAGITAALEEVETRRRVSMQIEPFSAEDVDGKDVRVVAVVGPPDDLGFVVLVETAEGEIFPSIRPSVYRKSPFESSGRAC